MMEKATEYVSNILPYPTDRGGLGNKPPSAPLQGGGGGGTFDEMEARLAKLEAQFGSIDAKLDRVVDKLDHLVPDVAEIKGRISTFPSTAMFTQMTADIAASKARIDALPTLRTFSILLAIATALYSFAPQLQAAAQRIWPLAG